MNKTKVALVHDWLTGMRGGDKCLEALCELFPDAVIYTLMHNKGSCSQTIEKMKIRTSFIQKMPFVSKKYRSYLPLFPTAIESFDVREHDLIISSSHCVAKGVIPHAEAMHLCYCHTPMRYVWAMYQEYFGGGRTRSLSRLIIPIVSNYLRAWDVASSNRVDEFIANSENVKRRIWRYYRRTATVIYPPVSTKGTQLSQREDGYFLIVSAFAPYKRIDLAIRAFNQLGEKLVIVGSGPEEKRLKKLAHSNIEFVEWVDSDDLAQYYANCSALVFPGEEDLGIVPLEAQCYGKPVVAYGAGGALETVLGRNALEQSSSTQKVTGIFFQEPTAEGLISAIHEYHKTEFNHEFIRSHALKFDKEVFKNRMKSLIEEKLQNR